MTQTLSPSLIWLFVAVAPLRVAGQTSPWLHFTLDPGGPPLDQSSIIYDSASNSLIVFGGNGSQCCTSSNDTWLLTNANATVEPPAQWRQLSPAGTLPSPRSGQSAVYDQAHDRMIVFGGGQFNGYDYGVLFNDVWVLTHASGNGGTPTWVPITPPGGAPAPREGHQAVYNPGSNTMTIFGGGNNGIMDVPNDVWVLSYANGLDGQPQWTQLSPSGNLPAARQNLVATYSTANNAMTVFGGCCPSFNDLWALSNASGGGPVAWEQLSASPGPAPRANNGAFGYDQSTDLLIVFGGFGYNPGFTLYNDTWMLTYANDAKGTPAWINTIPNGAPQSPPSSSSFLGAYDSVSQRLMALPDETNPVDLWVMTSRNGIDVSCSSVPPTERQLAELKREGILYAVVKVPQYDSGMVECSGQVETAQQQLNAFIAAGFKTAAYCDLLFETGYGNGTYQAQTCLQNITKSTTYPVQLSELSFVALDVEGTWPLVGAPARTLITQAAEAITAAVPHQPVIYTDPGDWEAITGAGYGNTFSAYELWLAHPDGLPSLTPFPLTAPFYGWTVLSGKQYKQNVTQDPSGVKPVDYDVFDPTLFP